MRRKVKGKEEDKRMKCGRNEEERGGHKENMRRK